MSTAPIPWLQFYILRPNTNTNRLEAFVLHLLAQLKLTFLHKRLATPVWVLSSPRPGLSLIRGTNDECGHFLYDAELYLSLKWTLDRLPGPPLSYDSAITTLLAKGVNVAIGVVDEYTARNTRFDLAWVKFISRNHIPEQFAYTLSPFIGCLGVSWTYQQSPSHCPCYHQYRECAWATTPPIVWYCSLQRRRHLWLAQQGGWSHLSATRGCGHLQHMNSVVDIPW